MPTKVAGIIGMPGRIRSEQVADFVGIAGRLRRNAQSSNATAGGES